MIMDLMKVCRTCLRIPEISIKLFGGDNTLLNKISTISSEKIVNKKGLSSYICYECYAFINSFYNFKKLIKQTNDDLTARLQTIKFSNGLTKRKSFVEVENFNLITESDPLFLNDCTTEVDIDKFDPDDPIQETETLLKNNDQFITNETNQVNRTKVKTERTYTCNECNLIFITKGQLRGHNLRTHSPKRICTICGIEVIRTNFKRHLLIHEGKPCRCDICGKMCKHREALNNHKSFNHREKLCICGYCGKTFSIMARLTEHLKDHTVGRWSRRSKLCSVCGIRVENIDKHMRSHTGEKPCVCKYCCKGLSSPYALKLHMRLHTDERPYACEFCDNKFRQMQYLRSHLQSKHGS